MSAAPDWMNQHEISLATLEVVLDIVKRAETKLSVLEAQRIHVLRRIHALRYLAEMAARQEQRRPDLIVSRRTLAIVPKKRLESTRANHQQHAASRDHKSSSNLRRACRIALMESEGSQSSLQILERITKRESFTFGNYRDPQEAISQELNQMADEGEVVRLDVARTQCWEWKRK
jgi:hypothetical protein